jgi:hypothetical protein
MASRGSDRDYGIDKWGDGEHQRAASSGGLGGGDLMGKRHQRNWDDRGGGMSRRRMH